MQKYQTLGCSSLYKIIRCCFPLFNDCSCNHFGLFNPADITELPPPSPSSPETSCLYLSLTWPPLKNDTPPIHPCLFLSSPAKPFDLLPNQPVQSQSSSLSPSIFHKRTVTNVFECGRWRGRRDGWADRGGFGGLVSGMVASSFTAYISHMLLLVEEKGPRR